MLPGGFVGLAINRTGGIIVVPFSKSTNQFQKVFGSPTFTTNNVTLQKQLEALGAEQQATRRVLLDKVEQVDLEVSK